MGVPVRTKLWGGALVLGALLAVPAIRAVTREPAAPGATSAAVRVESGPVCSATRAQRTAAVEAQLARLRERLAERRARPDGDRVVVLNGRGYNYQAPSFPADFVRSSLESPAER